MSHSHLHILVCTRFYGHRVVVTDWSLGVSLSLSFWLVLSVTNLLPNDMGFDMLNDLFIVLSTELCVVPESQILWVDHCFFCLIWSIYSPISVETWYDTGPVTATILPEIHFSPRLKFCTQTFSSTSKIQHFLWWLTLELSASGLIMLIHYLIFYS